MSLIINFVPVLTVLALGTSLVVQLPQQGVQVRSLVGVEIDGETLETVSDLILGAPKSLQMVTAAMKLKNACSLEGKF